MNFIESAEYGDHGLKVCSRSCEWTEHCGVWDFVFSTTTPHVQTIVT